MSFDTQAVRAAVERIPAAPEWQDPSTVAVFAALVFVDLPALCDEVDSLRAALAEIARGHEYAVAEGESVWATTIARVALGEQS